jgi:hypothetical protein
VRGNRFGVTLDFLDVRQGGIDLERGGFCESIHVVPVDSIAGAGSVSPDRIRDDTEAGV